MNSNTHQSHSSRQPWKTEVEVDVELARQLITSQFPELHVKSVNHYGQGWDNIAYLVNGEFVFRFPTRAIGGECMLHELAVLPLLARQLPPLLPRLEFIGRPATDYPWSFSGYRELKGATACSVNWSDAEREALAIPLATFLRQLHGLAPGEVRAAGAPGDLIGRMNPERRIPQTREHLARAHAEGLIQSVAEFEPIISAFESSIPTTDVVPVHGDLYVRHIVVDDQRRLVGFIDWGDVHLGDAAVDLAIAHAFLPPSFHAAFRDTYGSIDENTWHRARFRSLQHTSVLTMYCHDVGDNRLLDECRLSLARLVSST